MTTTTLGTIRDAVISVVEGLTPSTVSDARFRLCPTHTSLRAFASAGTAALRSFELVRTGDDSLPPLFDPDAKETTTTLSLVVAYPRDRALYGDREDLDLEDVMREDAAAIRSAVFDPDAYVTGQSLADGTILPPETSNPAVWFQSITLRVTFTEAL